MAENWIAVEHTTPTKPEVLQIAIELDLDPDTVVGKLIRLWIWADQNTYDGSPCNGVSVTAALLDRVVGVTGFAASLCNVGWCVEKVDAVDAKVGAGVDAVDAKVGALWFPNFGDHNGRTAKSRKKGAQRVAEFRDKSSKKTSEAPSDSSRTNSGNADVTVAPLQKVDGTVTDALPQEQEQEQEHKEKSKPKKKRFTAPTVDEVRAYCEQRSNNIDPERFFDFYEANGWVQGRGKPLKCWKAAVRVWERNDGKSQAATNGKAKQQTPYIPTAADLPRLQKEWNPHATD